MADESRGDLEKAIIGAVLMDPGRAMTIAEDKGVRSSWFEDDDYAALFEAAHRAYQADSIDGLDQLGLAEEAKKVAAGEKWERPIVRLEDTRRVVWLSELIDAGANIGTLEHHVNSLRGFVYQRSFAKAFQASMKQFLVDPLGAISMLMEKASETYTAIAG